jgi:hypothetical protein
VAEFSNTASTLPIIVLPLLNAMMLREYIEVVNFNVLIPHLLLTFNGLASSYYHATLNLFGNYLFHHNIQNMQFTFTIEHFITLGQLVDEVSIIWLLNSCVFAFLPTFRSWPYELRNQV